MNIMNADDFYYNALLGSQRQSKNALKLSKGKTNVFWFEPKLFTSSYAGLSNVEIIKSKSEFLKGNFKKAGIPVPVVVDEKDWLYKAEFKLFDQNANLVMETELDDIKLGHAVPNKSYLTPYVIYKRKKYYGVTVAFPHLNEGLYNLDIHEQWKSPFLSFNIQRKLNIPFIVSPDYQEYNQTIANPNIDDNQPIWSSKWYKDEGDTICYLNLLDNINREIGITKVGDFKKIGTQSISLNQDLVPTININMNDGIAYSSWYGSNEELKDSYLTYYRIPTYLTKKVKKEINDLLTIDKWAPLNSNMVKGTVAAIVNAHTTKYKRQLDHSGDGIVKIQSKFHAGVLNETCFTLGITSK